MSTKFGVILAARGGVRSSPPSRPPRPPRLNRPRLQQRGELRDGTGAGGWWGWGTGTDEGGGGGGVPIPAANSRGARCLRFALVPPQNAVGQRMLGTSPPPSSSEPLGVLRGDGRTSGGRGAAATPPGHPAADPPKPPAREVGGEGGGRGQVEAPPDPRLFTRRGRNWPRPRPGGLVHKATWPVAVRTATKSHRLSSLCAGASPGALWSHSRFILA